jgi:hypothetical protein
VPGVDHTVELENLLLEDAQLDTEAARHARATSGTCGSAAIPSSSSTPRRPSGATIPNSSRWARIALITAVCWRMSRCRVRWRHQAALLLRRFGLDKPHVGPGNSLADSLGISGVVLESWEPQEPPHPWHSRAGGGAVHSIKSRRELVQQFLTPA